MRSLQLYSDAGFTPPGNYDCCCGVDAMATQGDEVRYTSLMEESSPVRIPSAWCPSP